MIFTYLPPAWVLDYSAKHENDLYPHESVYIPETKQEPVTTETRLHQAITTSGNDLRAFLRAVSVIYGQDYEKMRAVVQKESSFNPGAIGDDGFSIGIAQYTRDTWNGYCQQFGIYEDKDPYAQLSCMGLMWQNGMQRRWTAYRELFE